MPVGGKYFSSVKKARAVLQERANELVDMYILGMKKALAENDFETFQKGMHDLISHIAPEDGDRVFEIHVDKPKQIESKPALQGIQIGVAIGGINQSKALPEVTVIDVTPTRSQPTTPDEAPPINDPTT
jgi:hypothetical protein